MLKRIFDQQAQQQIELGLDPKNMDDHDRLVMSRRVILGLHEEVVELQRETTSYKRHILRLPETTKENIADECADVMKYLVTLAQMHDINAEDLAAAFSRKTSVVRAKAAYDRLTFGESEKVVCVDLDDVVCDLSDWQTKLKGIGSSMDGEDRLRVLEDFKDRFYKRGGFRDLAVMPGAKPALHRIADAGYRIVVITARPAAQYKRVFADTLAWLANHRIPHDKVIFSKDKLEAVHENVVPAWPVVFIEDHPKTAISLSSAGVPVLLFNQPHNERVEDGENLKRVANWTAVLDHIFNDDADEAARVAADAEYAESLRNSNI